MIARKVVCRMTKREARAWAKARRAELDMAAVGRGMAQALFSLPQWQSAGAALALVPCLAASRDGVRLGRGGGYYDRFLAHYKGAGLLLCPEALLLDELPCDDWDARFAPENILTEKGILR